MHLTVCVDADHWAETKTSCLKSIYAAKLTLKHSCPGSSVRSETEALCMQDKLTPKMICSDKMSQLKMTNLISNKSLDTINQRTDIWGGDVHKYTVDLRD